MYAWHATSDNELRRAVQRDNVRPCLPTELLCELLKNTEVLCIEKCRRDNSLRAINALARSPWLPARAGRSVWSSTARHCLGRLSVTRCEWLRTAM